MNQIAKIRIQNLDQIANNPIDSGQPVTVFRGIEIANAKDKRIFDQIMSGKEVYTMKSFGSTSVNYKTARSFAAGKGKTIEPNVIMKIRTKKGAYIDNYSIHGGEREVLLPRGSKFRVTSKKLVRDWDAPGNGSLTLMVEMTREDGSKP